MNMKRQDGLMMIAKILEAIAIFGDENDIDLALKSSCELDDELIKKYWEKTKQLVASEVN